MIQISIPSSSHPISKNDFSFDITDFDSYNISKPELLKTGLISYAGGTNHDVILSFETTDDLNKYSLVIGSEKLDNASADEPTIIKNKKIGRIIKSINLYLELQDIIERVNNKDYIELSSNFKYSFRYGSTLTISGYPTNEVNYAITIRNDKIYLDTDRQIASEELEIVINTNNIIELQTEFNHKIEVRLREV